MLSLNLPITRRQRRAEVFKYFEYLGYIYEGELKNTDYWGGTITLRLSKTSLVLQILISIDDWNFTTLPHLYLREPLPVSIQKHVPLAHLQIRPVEFFDRMYYGFCYSLPDRNELPRLNPTEIINYVFSQTESVLKQLIESESERQIELYREIEPTWRILCNNQNHNISPSLIFDPIRVNSFTERISFTIYQTQEKQLPFFLVNIDSRKIPPISRLLPLPNLKGNWHSLCTWLDQWQKSITPKLLGAIKKNSSHIKRNRIFGVAIICNHTVLPIYFTNIDDPSIFVKQAKNNKNLQKLKDIHFIFSYPGIYISENMLYQRSLEKLSQPDLSNKKILLIGCGAIGGYLALSLVKIGTGAGKNGVLTLIDPDIMGLQNTGRHLLGQEFVGLPKSVGLEITLKLQYPNINIDRIFASIFADQIHLDQYINKYDLIIDATGKIEVAETLNEIWQSASNNPKAALQHVWISSNGECVQSLLVLPTEHKACRSCIRQSGLPFRSNEHIPLPDKIDTVHAFRACSDYTPYAVSASQSASALATDSILDWLRDQPEPLYRTRYTERWKGNKIESSSPEPHPECPYCQGKKSA